MTKLMIKERDKADYSIFTIQCSTFFIQFRDKELIYETVSLVF
jgi:hypothetical protein